MLPFNLFFIAIITLIIFIIFFYFGFFRVVLTLIIASCIVLSILQTGSRFKKLIEIDFFCLIFFEIDIFFFLCNYHILIYYFVNK
jgi:hypothetical protein